MATITRPEDVVGQSNVGVSYDTARLAGRGEIGVGEALGRASNVIEDSAARTMNEALKVSALVDAEGQKLFETSKKAHQSAVLLNKMTEATEKFLTGQKERYSKETDADGNPVFTNLHKDIGDMGNGILQDVMGSIIDPEVAREFQAQFGQYVAHQKLSALKKGLKQQTKFGEDALNKGLKTLISQAISDDPSQVQGYESQGLQAIQNALSGGIISSDNYDKLSKGFTEEIRGKSIENLITNDPVTAGNVLMNSTESLGISPGLHSELKSQLSTKIKATDIEYAKAALMQDTDKLTEKATLMANVKNLINAGAIRGDDILKLKGSMSKKDFNSVKNMYIASVKKQEDEQRALNDMGMRLIDGRGFQDLNAGQVNKFYDYLVKQKADMLKAKPTLQDEAMLASMINVPIKKFTDKLETNLIHGKPVGAEDMIAAYTYIKDTNSSALDTGFSPKSLAIAEQTKFFIEDGGLTPNEALIQARESVLNVKDDIRKQRLDAFNSEARSGAFSESKIEETAASALPGAETWWGKNRISEDAMLVFKKFAREGYAETGTKKGAIGYATEMMKKNFGVSEISGEKKFTKRPIEKVYGNTYHIKDLRDALIEDSKSKLPAGIDPATVSLKADDFSGENVRLTKNGKVKVAPSWIVTYKKKFGDTFIEDVIPDLITGKPLRWGPEYSDWLSTKSEREKLQEEQRLESLKQENIKRRITPADISGSIFDDII